MPKFRFYAFANIPHMAVDEVEADSLEEAVEDFAAMAANTMNWQLASDCDPEDAYVSHVEIDGEPDAVNLDWSCESDGFWDEAEGIGLLGDILRARDAGGALSEGR